MPRIPLTPEEAASINKKLDFKANQSEKERKQLEKENVLIKTWEKLPPNDPRRQNEQWQGAAESVITKKWAQEEKKWKPQVLGIKQSIAKEMERQKTDEFIKGEYDTIRDVASIKAEAAPSSKRTMFDAFREKIKNAFKSASDNKTTTPKSEKTPPAGPKGP